MIAIIYNTTLTMCEPPPSVFDDGREAIEQYITSTYGYPLDQIVWGMVDHVNDYRGKE